jgi:hypothetical protein
VANALTQEDIIEFVTGLPGVRAVTATDGDGSPEIAWGDTFFFYDPAGADPADQRLPFATIVTKDYPGFDLESRLDRPGAFRLNIFIGRRGFDEFIGYPHTELDDHRAGYDFSAADQVMPHPIYGVQGWACIVNPREATADQVRAMLRTAQTQAAQRRKRRI